MNTIEIKNLHFSYNAGEEILKGLNLTIDERSTAIIGQNGAGKTTFVKLLKGLLRPTEGQILFNGQDISKQTVATLAKDIGLIFQNPNDQIFKNTVLDEVMFGPMQIGMSKDKAKEVALKALDMVGLKGTEKINPYDLGLSERKMVSIAAIVAMDTKVVIFDEPTNGLDPNQIVEIRHLIKEIAEERTVILSTHILPEVQATCDYIRMIEQGNMVFSGTVEEFDNYIQPNTLVVSLGALPLVADIQALPGVVRVEELGGPRFRIQFSDVKEAINSIVEASYTRDWQLMELQQEKSSLDTIFAELSKK